ncbi:hypothetical protein LAZ67_12002472 [Cordylochernes scorpioides]|uniref:ZP domain-containing protein n=1 Tax=Cordylochernes scorpioides TaxID=51811 RepID=A0ABY6L5C0_9ARAC|nr:hypothetical protein LAZ67_12002472 [Cordylochernes scorpioides]
MLFSDFVADYSIKMASTTALALLLSLASNIHSLPDNITAVTEASMLATCMEMVERYQLSNSTEPTLEAPLEATEPYLIRQPLLEREDSPLENLVDPPLGRVENMSAECFPDHMEISITFNGSFRGLVYSTGYAHDAACVYVRGDGSREHSFPVFFNRCGTLGHSPPARSVWNTLTVQYSPDIEEITDEHFRSTCDFGFYFRRTVTFPMVDVGTNTEFPALNQHQGSPEPPRTFMEIRAEHQVGGPSISGPVVVGDPLTLLVHMETDTPGRYDLAITNCSAHNGGLQRLRLTDAQGCVLKPNLVGSFQRTTLSTRHTVLYSYLKAFRFTGSPALYLECDVRMCQGSCGSI